MQPPFASLSPNQANAYRGGSPRNYVGVGVGPPTGGYMGSAYQAMPPRLQYPVAYPGGLRPFSGPSSPLPPDVSKNHAATSSTVSADHVEGSFS